MQQNYYNQPTQVKYREPEYLIKPTWRLAWGLLWRMLLIQIAIVLPIYIAVLVITLS